MLKRLSCLKWIGLGALLLNQQVTAHPDNPAPAAPLFDCIDAERAEQGPLLNRVVPARCDALEAEFPVEAGADEPNIETWQLHHELWRRDIDPIAHVHQSIMDPRELARQSLLSSHEGLFNDAKAAPIVVASQTPAASQREVTQTIEAWLEAWSNRKVDSYLSFYSPDFTTGEPDFSFAKWGAGRRERLHKPSWISVKAKGLQVVMENEDQATVSFQQEYRSSTLSETTHKTVVLRRQYDLWRIHSEATR